MKCSSENLEALQRRKKREKLQNISYYARILTHGASRSFLIRINRDTIPYFKATTAEAIQCLSQKGSMAYRLIFFSPVCQTQDI